MKTTRFFAVIACSAAVAASCMKDDLKRTAYAEPIFSAVREDFGDPASRTMLTDNYKVVWCSGDEVGVFDGSVYPREGVGSGSKLVNKESGWEYGLRFKTTDNGASAGKQSPVRKKPHNPALLPSVLRNVPVGKSESRLLPVPYLALHGLQPA